MQSRGRDKLEHPLQLPQASPQLLPNCRPLRPCCPSQLVKGWTVLEDVAHCLLNLTTLTVGGGSDLQLLVHVLLQPAVSGSNYPEYDDLFSSAQQVIVIPLRPLLPEGFDQGLFVSVLCQMYCLAL